MHCAKLSKSKKRLICWGNSMNTQKMCSGYEPGARGWCRFNCTAQGNPDRTCRNTDLKTLLTAVEPTTPVG